MDDWKDKVIELIEKVLKHGWGGCEIKISRDGKKRTIKHWLTDVSEDDETIKKD